MGGFPSPVTTYEKSRRSDAVPDNLAPASSTPAREQLLSEAYRTAHRQLANADVGHTIDHP